MLGGWGGMLGMGKSRRGGLAGVVPGSGGLEGERKVQRGQGRWGGRKGRR